MEATFVSWLVTNVDLSQIFYFLAVVLKDKPMDFFPTADRGDGVSLTFYLCLHLNLGFLLRFFINVVLLPENLRAHLQLSV